MSLLEVILRARMPICLMAVGLAGCYSWQTVESARITPDLPAERVCVTDTARERSDLRAVTVDDGVLTGRHGEVDVVFPLASMIRLEARRFSATKTGLLVAGGLSVLNVGGQGAGGIGWSGGESLDLPLVGSEP